MLSIGDPAGVRRRTGCQVLSIGDPAGVRRRTGCQVLSIGDPLGLGGERGREVIRRGQIDRVGNEADARRMRAIPGKHSGSGIRPIRRYDRTSGHFSGLEQAR